MTISTQHTDIISQFQLDERLKREGAKTHKERVEDLNRYLSNLSEHHDMYAFLSLYLRRLLLEIWANVTILF